MLGYFITFIANFVIACFFYDGSGVTKPLIHSIIIVILIFIVDLISKNKKNNQKSS
ncbi:hypothetical protein BFO01nite_37430 [Brevibacillus formosus]|uniref:Uncharacterized protein n=1 Tax=Brevibacillus formosus TaxID=54913 RepID=A0ABQ0T8G0_9BACL|nr:hypothetical protein BFO01nite_37430 [Brevibacillus formosus]